MSRVNAVVRNAGLLTLILALFTAGCDTSPEGPMGPPLEPQLTVTSGSATSPFTGPEECRSPFGGRQCIAQPFDRTHDLAFPGNGWAQPAVARDVIPGYSAIHSPEFANDGFYGNGASWISNSAGSWVKIDLGRTVSIDRITFGRDRAGWFNDRDPGQFTIEVATSDDVYANGDDGNDAVEYSLVLNSQPDGFSGFITGTETVEATFAPAVGRFVKLTFARRGAAIDEIEVMGVVLARPQIAPIDGATLFTGETFAHSGSFVDPDPDDSWTGTVDYGDGTGPGPLTLAAGKTFELSHQYKMAGDYTVTVSVSDGLFTSSGTAEIEVLTPAKATARLESTLHEMVANGAVAAQSARPLSSPLRAAQRQYERGNPTAGNNQMSAFQNQVTAGVRTGRIAPPSGQELMQTSSRVIEAGRKEEQKPGRGRGRKP